jgi:hypothetical protein
MPPGAPPTAPPTAPQRTEQRLSQSQATAAHALAAANAHIGGLRGKLGRYDALDGANSRYLPPASPLLGTTVIRLRAHAFGYDYHLA